jgi:enoyl-CoA hydratase/carnithine racemase
MCDIRIASEYAKFAASFVKIGIAPGDGGAWWLPRAVGMAKASEMVFTGDVIDAAEALACGLVSKVVPAEKLMAEAGDLAARIAANPHHALRLSKRLLRESERLSLESLLELSAAFQGMLYHTEDRKKAVAALVESLEARSKKGSTDA